MDGVPPGDVTGCLLSVIVPHHGHLAKQHSNTVSMWCSLFHFPGLKVLLLELTV